MNFMAGILLASVFLLQGVGGNPGGFGGKGGGIGGSAPVPSATYGTNCSTASNTVTTVNCTVSGVSAGDFIAVYYEWWSTASITSVADSAGTLVPALSSHPVIWDAGTRSVDLYYEANASSGSHKISITLPASNTIGVAVETFHGASISSTPLDGSSSIVITSNTSPYSCGSITTTQGNDVIFAGTGVLLNTPVAGSGYTGRNTLASHFTTADGPASTIGTYTPTFTTVGTAKPGVCLSMAIKHV